MRRWLTRTVKNPVPTAALSDHLPRPRCWKLTLAAGFWRIPARPPEGASPARHLTGSGGLVEAGGGQVLLAKRGEVDVELRVVRLGLDAELVSAVLAEPVDVLGQVRRDVRQVLRVDFPALLQQLTDDLRDVQGIVESPRS
jgi:hypothetical protein